jgi:hypothetical protein
MKEYRMWLVEYTVGDLDKEVQKPTNYVDSECQLVLCAHDGKKKSWVMDNEHVLKKKGMGCGMHHSEVICSTMGWLKEAGQDLE